MLFRSIVWAAGSQGGSCLPDVHFAPWSIYVRVLGCHQKGWSRGINVWMQTRQADRSRNQVIT